MPHIRPARKEDIPRLLALYDELALVHSRTEDFSTPSPGEYERTLDRINAVSGLELLVLEEGREVVGLMELLILPNLSHNALPWAMIEGLIVDARFRNRGFGKILVDHAIEKAKRVGCYKIILTSNKKRLDAHRFYRTLGFIDTSLGFRLDF